ncbi:hypothetical protein K435DRAFT_877782 [Dendrothele bispora CBS 962.96]|uniref:Uncharacterized protein n=2 Tax=Dendrothele bispora (strain CBS 962.96) TaxID=1314807 RepID=A0A4S8KQ84_DENBC|nr:hypothetical protein K435DRAFT_877782 [Dendrothele bispora CBS 962.96]
MSATTGSTGFKSSEWLTKLSEAREQVVAISNMKNAGAILVTAVQAFGDALFERVDFHEFRKVPECVAAYHDHAKTLNGIVDKFNIDKKKLNCLEKINNFSESLRKAQEEAKNRGKGKRKRIVSARTVEDSDDEIEIVTAPATGDTDVTMAEPGLAASAHAPKNVKDLPKISKKNAAAGKAGGTTRTIATRASTADYYLRKAEQAQQDEYARKKTRIFNGSVSNFNPPTTEPIETPQELVQKTNVGVFMDYNRLPDESLNALQNYLRAELLSVAHQVHFLTSHYRSTYDHLVSVIQTKLGRTEIEGGTSTVSQDPALQGLAPSASVVATQVDSTTVDNQAAIEVDNNADEA